MSRTTKKVPRKDAKKKNRLAHTKSLVLKKSDSIQKIHTEAVPVSGPVTPDTMIMYALQNGHSMEQIEKLIQLRNGEIARVARLNFFESKKEFQRVCPPITKNKPAGWDHKKKEGKEPGKTEYWFAELLHVEGILKEPLANNGFTYDWKTTYEGNDIIVTCILSHVGGHQEMDSMRAPADMSGGKNAIQASASTVSYLRRYTLQGVTGKSAGNDDKDGAIPKDKTEEGHMPKASKTDIENAIKGIISGAVTLDSVLQQYAFTMDQVEALKIADQNRSQNA